MLRQAPLFWLGGAHVHPATPGPGHGRVARLFDGVGVIDGDAVEQLPAGEDAVPRLLKAGHAAVGGVQRVEARDAGEEVVIGA